MAKKREKQKIKINEMKIHVVFVGNNNNKIKQMKNCIKLKTKTKH